MPTSATITELNVDATTLKVTVVWSRSATITGTGTVVLAAGHPCAYLPTVPAALIVGGTSLIWSEVNYLYKPAVGYGLMPQAGINLSDVAYTRPRQSSSVTYTTACP